MSSRIIKIISFFAVALFLRLFQSLWILCSLPDSTPILHLILRPQSVCGSSSRAARAEGSSHEQGSKRLATKRARATGRCAVGASAGSAFIHMCHQFLSSTLDLASTSPLTSSTPCIPRFAPGLRYRSFTLRENSLRTSSPRTTFGRAQLFRAHALSLRLSASAPLCSLQSNKNQGSQSPASNPHGFSAGCPVCSLAYLLRFTTEKRSARPASSNPKTK